MATDRRRVLELALESLESKRRQIELEIEGLTRELRGGARGRQSAGSSATAAAPAGGQKRRRSRFTKDERLRRSARMKAYWENWRKQKRREK